MPGKLKRARETDRRLAGPDHAVLTVEGGGGSWRREPCESCPWRVDQVGRFPPEAFRQSAGTAYDMNRKSFGCHVSGAVKPATCAGFLLRGATHNMTARLRWGRGQWTGVGDGGHELHRSYRAMAVANGVDPDDPVLAPCREPD